MSKLTGPALCDCNRRGLWITSAGRTELG
ncbi:hypothetical protein ARTHRO8AJ_300022 [Arthrobacter sp. 8AJ]|nr:hypothetical protein ARTHRO8AJ_300022 [Arthrobacter sp. 8AJ]